MGEKRGRREGMGKENKNGEKERRTDRQIQTDRHRQMQRDRQTDADRQTETDRHRCRQAGVAYPNMHIHFVFIYLILYTNLQFFFILQVRVHE